MKVRFRPRDPSSATPWLTVDNVYDVIGIEADDLRIMSDVGEPCLYRADEFEVIDASEPAEWTSSVGEGGERYAYPPELNQPGFFEDWHDGNEEARRTLAAYLSAKRIGR